MVRCILLSLSVYIVSNTTACGQQTARRTYHDYYVGYLEYLPPDYAQTNEKYPLMIFLHGGGETGDGSAETLWKVKAWGPPSLADNYEMCFTVEEKRECFILLSPQLNPDLFDWRTTVAQLLDHVFNGPEPYRVDTDRIYLTGLSRGGRGVYEFAASIHNSANKLAAIAPIAAWSDNPADGCIISKRNIPVWAFHGKDDTVVPHSLGLAAFNWVKDCPDPVADAEMIFTTYTEGYHYHDSWIPAYDPSHSYHSPNLYEWLLKHRRQAPDPPDPVTSIKEDPDRDLSIHPNPAGDKITVTAAGELVIPVEIVSVTGRVVMTLKPTDVTDISALPAGVYVVRVGRGKSLRSVRFVKK